MKDFLPIGSVVLLKDAEKRLMICGRIQVQTSDKQIFDYSGCLYPEGMLSPDRIYLFNNEDIVRIYSLGLQDEEELAFKEQIKALLQQNGIQQNETE